MNQTRRLFIKNSLLGLTALSGAAPLFAKKAKQKVLVIGGGSGGATAAKYLKMMNHALDITLIEAKPYYTTCYMSNEVLSGKRTLASLEWHYNGLQKRGIKIVQDKVIALEPNKKQAITASGQTYHYDRCILATGIDFKWHEIEGHSAAIAQQIPHAWQAGKQTQILHQQIKKMKMGGTLAITIPAKPYRCTPAPYERVGQIAHYFKQYNPSAKIVIFDSNTQMPMGAHFKHIWKRDFGYTTENSMIEWRNGEDESGIVALDAKTKTLTTAFDDHFQADVINLIPPQQASDLAVKTGLTDQSGWCPVQFKTLESVSHPHLHIIGDAAKLDILPKSAYAANSQAKVCAIAIDALFRQQVVDVPTYMNSCYAMMAEDYAVSSVAVYKMAQQKTELVRVSGAITPLDSPTEMFQREVAFAHNWYRNITDDIFN